MSLFPVMLGLQRADDVEIVDLRLYNLGGASDTNSDIDQF